MRRPWRKPKNGYAKSQEAVRDSAQSLAEIRSRDPEVHAVSKALKTIREQNHFAEQLASIMGGR
jgi:hypothetical protein